MHVRSTPVDGSLVPATDHSFLCWCESNPGSSDKFYLGTKKTVASSFFVSYSKTWMNRPEHLRFFSLEKKRNCDNSCN